MNDITMHEDDILSSLAPFSEQHPSILASMTEAQALKLASIGGFPKPIRYTRKSRPLFNKMETRAWALARLGGVQ